MKSKKFYILSILTFFSFLLYFHSPKDSAENLITQVNFYQFYPKFSPTTELKNVSLENYDVLVVGAGLTGAVLAHLHASVLERKVLVLEKDSWVGGYCHDVIGEDGVRVSTYGPHIFHTDDPGIWQFVKKIDPWLPYTYREIGIVNGNHFSFPLNFQAINDLLDLQIHDPTEMKRWIELDAQNENLLRKLYESIIRPLNYKIWGINATFEEQLPFVNMNYRDLFYEKAKYQALPAKSYTHFIEKLLSHERIHVYLNTRFPDDVNVSTFDAAEFDHVFLTGSLEDYFSDSGSVVEMDYRYASYKSSIVFDRDFFQSNPTVVYPQENEAFTRVTEYKHFSSDLAFGKSSTTLVKEYWGDEGTVRFPLVSESNAKASSTIELLARQQEEKMGNIYYVSNMADLRYVSMAEAIRNAISKFERVNKVTGKKDDLIYSGPIDELPSEFHRTSLGLVVSHCKESLDWIEPYKVLCDYSEDFEIFIYEKCDSPLQGLEMFSNTSCRLNQMRLPNVGREGHTWLFHMLYRSASLKDLNMFLQGHSQFHDFNGVMELVNNMKNKVKDFSPQSFNDVSKGGLVDHLDTKLWLNCPLAGLERAEHAEPICFWFEQLTGTREKCLEFSGTFGGEFLVSNVLIRRTLSTHRDWMIKMYNVLSSNHNPIEGHYLERLWTSLFRFPELVFVQLDPEFCKLE